MESFSGQSYPVITPHTIQEEGSFHGEDVFIREVCEKYFSFKSDQQQHYLIGGEKPYVCNVSDEFSENRGRSCTVNVDFSHKPQSTASSHLCRICGKDFTRRRGLEQHVCIVKDFGTQNIISAISSSHKTTTLLNLGKTNGCLKFSCMVCGLSFEEETNLHTHLQTHKYSKPFISSIKISKSPHSVHDSTMSKVGTDEVRRPLNPKPLIYSSIENEISDPSKNVIGNDNMCLNSLDSINFYACDSCGEIFDFDAYHNCEGDYNNPYIMSRDFEKDTQSFPDNNSAEDNLLTNSSNTVENDSNRYEFSDERDIHLQPTTEKVDKPYILNVNINMESRLSFPSESLFVCHICKQSFSLKNELQRHFLLHANAKPYICHVCGLSFSSQMQLQKHYRMHPDEKPYACKKCPKQFWLKKLLERHSRNHQLKL